MRDAVILVFANKQDIGEGTNLVGDQRWQWLTRL
ncbi:unnamed protein product [Soboliphyme baturini]|uniref:GTP-binding protein n=1 Tax=Soboliphyme baturini TaxID=241478 RepID=A0A183IJU1_9BILA|nr:unnamed protein product [Soboliphyme baturini]